MENIKEFLKELKDKGIDVQLAGDNLELYYDSDELASAYMDELKENKSSIVKFLKELNTRVIEYENIPQVELQQSYELSSSQRRLWILGQLDKTGTVYNIFDAFEFEGPLDIDAFNRAINTILQRHEILRTFFIEDTREDVRQCIKSVSGLEFNVAYLDLVMTADKANKIIDVMNREAEFHFDLSEGPLLRCTLLRTEKNKHLFCYVMHHIISDAWSMEIMIRELLVLYNAYAQGKDNPLPPLRIQYKDYAAWQRQELKKENFKLHKEYWLSCFNDDLPVLNMPGAGTRPVLKTYNGGNIRLKISKEINDRVKQLCHSNGVSLFMGLSGFVNVLLFKYTQQCDMIIGTSVAGREHADTEGQIGFYVNTIALRTKFDARDSFAGLLNAMKDVIIESFRHQAYPFDQLVEDLALKRDLSRSLLFDVMVVLLGTDAPEINPADHLTGLTVKSYSNGENDNISKFDMTFNFIESAEELELRLEYNTDIFNRKYMEQLGENLIQIINYAVNDPGITLLEIKKCLEKSEAELLKKHSEVLRKKNLLNLKNKS